jgi:hypothetical protein
MGWCIINLHCHLIKKSSNCFIYITYVLVSLTQLIDKILYVGLNFELRTSHLSTLIVEFIIINLSEKKNQTMIYTTNFQIS